MNKILSYFVGKITKPALLSLCVLGTYETAYAASCSPVGAAYIYNHAVDFNSTQNYLGFETPWQNLNRGGTYRIQAPCIGSRGATFFSFLPGGGLTQASTTADGVWFNIPGNDYLQVAMQVYIAGRQRAYFNIPSTGVSNLCTAGMCGNDFASGSQVKLKLRIKKKFVGRSFVVNSDVGLIYAATTGGDRPTVPVAIIRLNATMTVPQSCTFDVGDVIEFDFGQISSGAFSGVGAGNRAAGVNPMIKNIGIDCKNIDAQQMLSARIEVVKLNSNVIVSSNPDVGFQIADQQDRILTPNNISSFIPFRLNVNARGNFILKAWPVSITGKKPNAGPVIAEGHVRIDFQ